MRTPILFFVFLLSISACQQSSGARESATQSCSNELPSLSEEEIKEYREKGQAIALEVFTTMSGQLQKAMQEGGVSNAVQFCNLVAMPIVDSLSQKHNVTIKRTSLKVRNPKDIPTESEVAQLEQFQAEKDTGKPLQPRVLRQGENIAFYAPIGIQPLCLKCHGKIGETIAQSDYDVIQQLYPEDKAVGYQAGDLRGMWRITFN